MLIRDFINKVLRVKSERIGSKNNNPINERR